MRLSFRLSDLLTFKLVAALLFPLAAHAQLTDTITVTATRTETRVADTPASVVVLSKETLATTAAPALDDALRQVAGFTLFRRSGSRVANPTTQGVTLRGVGASGASRALVLDDGVPLNDPFGGWVYWGRVPRAAIGRVEVLRGGASDLYGSSAMGGVVQFVRRTTPALSVDLSAGSQQTGSATAFLGAQNWSVATDLFSTKGCVLVRPDDRGAVDVNANSDHAALDATARRGTLFARASYYRESRENGTPLQNNDTTIRAVAAGGDFGGVAVRIFGSDQDYFQTFSAIDATRSSERLTVEQSVPSRGLGGNAQWMRSIAGRHVFVAGAEARYAGGTSDELRYTPNGTFHVEASGRQRTAALYIEDLFAITPSLALTAGVRADGWRNTGGGAEHEETSLNPRVSLLWRTSPSLALSASAYKAFRAPTLNELYRGFRVGNINTLPNASLDAERLTGFELGARFSNVRLTLFEMDVDDTIANVTLSESNGTITRQRQNLGSTRSRGAELDAEWRLATDWRASAGALFSDAVVSAGDLEGKRVPQVPRAQATAQLQWRRIAAQARWSGMQFDDDRNALPLASYVVVDLFAAHPLTKAVELTAAIENIFDRDVEVSATPVITLGQPRAFRVGLRYER